MRKAQIGTVLKHFPGYGSNGDTHVNQIEDTRTYEQFVTRDYIPFEAGVNAGADCILVSHNVVAAIDDEYPASLSEKVHEEIRNVLQFDGVVITDDLMMSGVSAGYDLDEAAVQAVKAGMICCFPRIIRSRLKPSYRQSKMEKLTRHRLMRQLRAC